MDNYNFYEASQTWIPLQGTPAFQPPEVANGREQFSGFKIDVWSRFSISLSSAFENGILDSDVDSETQCVFSVG